MKKVNFYKVFTNKMIQLNEKNFMLKIISSFFKNQSEIKEQLGFNYIPDCKD